jgi:hypothetical protein
MKEAGRGENGVFFPSPGRQDFEGCLGVEIRCYGY